MVNSRQEKEDLLIKKKGELIDILLQEYSDYLNSLDFYQIEKIDKSDSFELGARG